MQGLNTDSTLKQLMFSYKGAQYCAAEAAEFKICRATPAGSYGDVEQCEPKVANFLQCYHDMVRESKANCASQYASAFDCLGKNLDLADASGEFGRCSKAMNDFRQCK